MPGKKIVIIDGHPDPRDSRFGHALAGGYATAATAAGHTVRRITLADIEVPFLRSPEEWAHGEVPETLKEAQEAIGWADHLVILYPLWLGSMPALLKAFLEQVLRPGFAIPPGEPRLNAGLLRGKSARIVVTMAMPAAVFRLFFLAHSLSAFKRNILRFVGIGPIATTLIGSIEAIGEKGREQWLQRIEGLGREGR